MVRYLTKFATSEFVIIMYLELPVYCKSHIYNEVLTLTS